MNATAIAPSTGTPTAPDTDRESTPPRAAATAPAYALAQFFADVGRVSPLGPAGLTVHMELGTTLPDGQAISRAHVMMSRDFARSLSEALARALEVSAVPPAAESNGVL